MGNVEEYAQKLEEYEKKKKLKAKVFNPKDLVKSAKTIREIDVDDPEIGTVKYGVLTMNDLLEIGSEAQTNADRSVKMLHRMLKKAYPDLTEQDIRDMPMDKATDLLTLLTKGTDFLQAQKK